MPSLKSYLKTFILIILYLTVSGVMSQTPKTRYFNMGSPYYDDYLLESMSTVQITKIHGIFESNMGSGVLINNTKNDGKPYILTSDHLYETIKNAGTVKYYINSNKCNLVDGNDKTCSSPYPNGGYVTTNQKRIIRSTHTDIMLIELNEKIPIGDVWYAGWTIEHPNTHSKIVCLNYGLDNEELRCQVSAGSLIGLTKFPPPWPYKSPFFKIKPNYGDLKEGASGAPIFNQNQLVIGIHSADHQDLRYSARLADAWPEFQPYLDPDNTGVKSLNARGFVSGEDGYATYEIGPVALSYKEIYNLNKKSDGIKGTVGTSPSNVNLPANCPDPGICVKAYTYDSTHPNRAGDFAFGKSLSNSSNEISGKPWVYKLSYDKSRVTTLWDIIPGINQIFWLYESKHATPLAYIDYSSDDSRGMIWRWFGYDHFSSTIKRENKRELRSTDAWIDNNDPKINVMIQLTVAGEGSRCDALKIPGYRQVNGSRLNSNSKSRLSGIKETEGLKEKTKNESGLHLYPNPVNNQFTLEVDSKHRNDAFLTLNDVLGNEVLRKQVSLLKGKNTIEMDNIRSLGLTNGIYILNINSPNIQGSTRMILKD